MLPLPASVSAPDRTGRLDAFGTTIFAEMSALATRTGSLNLGQGFPDTDGPPEILQAAVKAIQDGRGNQYPPGIGVAELRQAVSEHQRAHYGLDFDPDAEILITVGATEAIASSILGLTQPGDEVVVFEPYYDSYGACIELSGAVRRVVTLVPDQGRWTFDPAELRAAITPRTRLILLNSPHNPTGTVFSRAELQTVADAAIEHDLIVVSDEVYEHLVFDGQHVPIATLTGMDRRTVTISSAGKTFSVTGWKVGWACAPAELLSQVRAVKQFLTYVGSGPFQYAVAEALTQLPPAFYTGIAADLRDRRDRLLAGLQGLGLAVMQPQATYFATVDLDASGQAVSGQQWCRELPGRAGVVAIPMRVFYDSEVDRYVRFAFCKQPDVLDEAIKRLANLNEMSQ